MDKIWEQFAERARGAFSLSGHALAITTLIAANMMLSAWLNAQLPDYLLIASPILSVFGAIIVMNLIDGSLTPSMKVALMYFVGKDKSEKVRPVAYYVLAFATITFLLSAGFTFLSGYVISDMAIKEPAVADMEQARVSVESDYIRALESAKMAHEQSVAIRADVVKESERAISAAVAAQGKGFADAYYKSPNWLRSQSKREIRNSLSRVDRVVKEQDQRVKDADANVQRAYSAYMYALNEGRAKSDAAIEKISNVGMAAFERYEERLQTFTQNLWLMDFAFAIIYLLSGIVLAKSGEFTPEVSLSSVLSSKMKKRYERFVNSLEGEKISVGTRIDLAPDVSKIKRFLPVYLKRAVDSATEEARMSNRQKVDAYLRLLDNQGVTYTVDFESGTIRF